MYIPMDLLIPICLWLIVDGAERLLKAREARLKRKLYPEPFNG
jgi:hypothetical protein